MRAILILALVAVYMALPAQKQVSPEAVPEEVRVDFQQRFEEPAKVIWFQQGEQYWGARFVLEGEKAEVVYDHLGQWLQTESTVAWKQLPEPARDYAREHYGDYHAAATRQVTTRSYGVLFESELKKGLSRVHLTFDMGGSLIEEKEEIEEEAPPAHGLKGKFSKLMGK